MSADNSGGDLPFAEDFAARVLAAADRVVIRRSRTRWAGAAVAASMVAGLVVLAPWRSAPVAPRALSPASPVIANADLDAIALASAERDAQTEPLDFMFPDAAPLARFSRGYANTAEPPIATGDNNPFAEDPVEEDGS
ncbi:MAG TPA: hypothetical protein VLV55_12670 [Rhizomicrobium sp.]|nr:hypothetical protein [Rhizomicrobium sp.]